MLYVAIDVIATGGNFLIDLAPQPDGRFPTSGLKTFRELGAWLKVNGDAIYEIRSCAPYREGRYAYTRKKDDQTIFVFALYDEVDTPVTEPKFCYRRVSARPVYRRWPV